MSHEPKGEEEEEEGEEENGERPKVNITRGDAITTNQQAPAFEQQKTQEDVCIAKLFSSCHTTMANMNNATEHNATTHNKKPMDVLLCSFFLDGGRGRTRSSNPPITRKYTTLK